MEKNVAFSNFKKVHTLKMLAYNDQYTALVNPLQICELLQESMNACAPVWILLFSYLVTNVSYPFSEFAICMSFSV